MSVDEIRKKLFPKQKEDYGEKFQDHYLEIYKLYVSMADNISSRRQNANSFFLAVNTVLIAFIGYAKPCVGNEAGRFIWLLALAGAILCYAWYRLIRSYKDLNSGKFKVIHLIEESLPLSPYGAEWEAVGRGKDKKLYLPFTHVEIYVPWVFFVVYSIALFFSFPWSTIFSHIQCTP